MIVKSPKEKHRLGMEKNLIGPKSWNSVLLPQSMNKNPYLKLENKKENPLDLVGIDHQINHILFLNSIKCQAQDNMKIK